MSTINLVASMFSSPPLPGAISSNKTFQRPLMPVSKTRYTFQEQYEYHKKHLKQLQNDLARLESAAGASLNYLNGGSHPPLINNNNNHSSLKDEKYFDKDKYNYFQFEVSFSFLLNFMTSNLI